MYKRRIFTVVALIILSLTIFTSCLNAKVELNLYFRVDGEIYSTVSTNGHEKIAVPKDPQKDGYVFDGWYWDENKYEKPFTANSLLEAPISDNMSVYAKFTPKTVTPTDIKANYTVQYYLETLEGDSYSLKEADTLEGIVDGRVTAAVKNYEHFTQKSTDITGVVKADNSLTIKVYYTRDVYTVTFDGNGGTLKSGSEVQQIKYQGTAIAPTYKKSGYDFIGFDNDYTEISGNITLTAQWRAKEGTAEKLEMPTITSVKYDTVKWNAVEDADWYLVRINDDYTYETRSTECDIKNVQNHMGKTISKYGYIKVEVKAVGYDNYTDSQWSTPDESYYYIPSITDTESEEKYTKYGIGYGYNLIEDEYLNSEKLSESSIFDLSKLLRISRFSESQPGQSRSKSFNYRSIDEFISNTDVSFEYGSEKGCTLLGSIKMQINADIGFDYSTYKYNNTFVYTSTITWKEYSLKQYYSVDILSHCLSFNFLKDVYRESDSNTYGMTEDELLAYLYNTYGTHAVLGVSTGAELNAMYTVSTNKKDVAVQVEAGFKTSTSGGSALDQLIKKDFDIGISIDNQEEWKKQQSKATFTMWYKGSTGGMTSNSEGINDALGTWSKDISDDNAALIGFTKNGAISLSKLLGYIDSDLAIKYADYIDEKTDETYDNLYNKYCANVAKLTSMKTKNGQSTLTIDLSSYQKSGKLGDVYYPGLLDGKLTIYPVMLGKIDKIIIKGSYNQHDVLIDGFSIKLSKDWTDEANIVLENVGVRCADGQGFVDVTDAAKSLTLNVDYFGRNAIYAALDSDKSENTGLNVANLKINSKNADAELIVKGSDAAKNGKGGIGIIAKTIVVNGSGTLQVFGGKGGWGWTANDTWIGGENNYAGKTPGGGSNGKDGSSAISCAELTLNYTGYVALFGGDGGEGGSGGNVTGESDSDGQPKLPAGGNGANGGDGGIPVELSALNIVNCGKLLLQYGNGGKGGNGGYGGSAKEAAGHKPDNGGNGGNGGNGFVGGKGGNGGSGGFSYGTKHDGTGTSGNGGNAGNGGNSITAVVYINNTLQPQNGSVGKQGTRGKAGSTDNDDTKGNKGSDGKTGNDGEVDDSYYSAFKDKLSKLSENT